MALEVHSMKEHIFHITGCLSKMDPRFPVANEYMLLSGGLKTGSVHIDQAINKNNSGDNSQIDNITPKDQTGNMNGGPRNPNDSTVNFSNRGDDYDLDYTLLVPVIKISENEHEDSLILDMRKSAQCHSWLVARPDIDEKLQLWQDCFVSGPPRPRVVNDLINVATSPEKDTEEANIENSQKNQNDNNIPTSNQQPDQPQEDQDLSDELIYLCPVLVANWFNSCISQICQNTEYLQAIAQEQKGKGIMGIPNIVRCKIHPPGMQLILACGGTRIQYDLIPVISFYGWPKVAGNWLNLPHIWQNLDNVGEVTKGFHLIPPAPIAGSILGEGCYVFSIR